MSCNKVQAELCAYTCSGRPVSVWERTDRDFLLLDALIAYYRKEKKHERMLISPLI